jgi:hypothetical protein
MAMHYWRFIRSSIRRSRAAIQAASHMVDGGTGWPATLGLWIDGAMAVDDGLFVDGSWPVAWWPWRSRGVCSCAAFVRPSCADVISLPVESWMSFI